ncbi:hypothetical protein HLB25_15760 [Dickeya dadantii]|uniref:GAP1-N1 domain-containing protein n=1 Tax=Dickeya dadantii TaxID=204038 RepID=UPI001495A1EB|nr:hypothetical protein [Dickeya dadantii]NPE55986.1 hypothetical protein [Dickeya dadantii]NPE68080.1 hypothetical protein [Dickeya dadantii]
MIIDQCLFGYDDGHRLLASSLSLGEETSLLTELSDLAPGTVFGKSEGYWTGLPVASLGRYVLMRTWAAPEMPRPGCVWTHALLIKPALLESLSDLSILQSLVINPKNLLDFKYYRNPLDVQLPNDYFVRDRLDDGIVRNLLLSLYEKGSPAVAINSPGELDKPLFAVWSQQWPRLRRNFRFQTAASRSLRKSNSVRFDIMAVLNSTEEKVLGKSQPAPAWLSVATSDIHNDRNSLLRSFLWSYGRDVRRQRGSFIPLVEIYTLDHETHENTTQRVIDILLEYFSDQKDAEHLKQDLVNGNVVADAQPGLIKFMMLDDDNELNILPTPTSVGINKLSALWTLNSNILFEMIEISEKSKNDIGSVIFKKAIDIIKNAQFWSLSYNYPYARKLIIGARPELLIDAPNYLDDDSLIDLVPVLPRDVKGLDNFISRFLHKNNSKLVNVFYNYFPKETTSVVIHSLNYDDKNIVNIWVKELTHRPELLLHNQAIGLISRSSMLLKFADALGWISPSVIDAGVAPWYSALVNSKNDLHEDEMDVIGCFLVVLSCKTGGENGLRVVELFYDYIHKKILLSRLTNKANDILSPYLPDLGWSWNWDEGHRFRMLIIRAFIDNKWSPYSFSTLAKDKKERSLLVDTVSETPGGESYFKAVLK